MLVGCRCLLLKQRAPASHRQAATRPGYYPRARAERDIRRGSRGRWSRGRGTAFISSANLISYKSPAFNLAGLFRQLNHKQENMISINQAESGSRAASWATHKDAPLHAGEGGSIREGGGLARRWQLLQVFLQHLRVSKPVLSPRHWWIQHNWPAPRCFLWQLPRTRKGLINDKLSTPASIGENWLSDSAAIHPARSRSITGDTDCSWFCWHDNLIFCWRKLLAQTEFALLRFLLIRIRHEYKGPVYIEISNLWFS